MAWKAYKVVFRLCSPLHIGDGKVGNLQRTRPYITGRNLWGTLTARLTRDAHKNGKPTPKAYGDIGNHVHQELAFTYFFPTTAHHGSKPLFPLYNRQGQLQYGLNGNGLSASTFRYRFLSTYASTALNYTSVSAEEASLHEVECLLPYTRADKNTPTEPVYLTGYIFQKESSDLGWEGALERLQIGGERGYGWGRVEVEVIENVLIHKKEVNLFDVGHIAHLGGENVCISVSEGQPILAHTLAAKSESEDDQSQALPPGVIEGGVEPLVGRVTKPDSRFGVNFSNAQICYTPGARVVVEGLQVQIGPFGVWEAV